MNSLFFMFVISYHVGFIFKKVRKMVFMSGYKD